MTHGGKRHGAGRHPGTPNKASARLVQAIAQTGLTPIDIMVGVMRCTFDMAQQELKQKKPDERKFKWAFELALESAHRAAPFAHPRLSAVEPEPGATIHYKRLTADELRTFIPLLEKCIADLPAGTTEGDGAAPPDART